MPETAQVARPGPTRPPRCLNLVRDPPPEERNAAVDWTSWYLTDEEDMGENCQHDVIIEIFRNVLAQLARERGWTTAFVGSDAFFGWVPEEPLVRISPDVYLLFDPPRPLPESWQTWRPGHRPPEFAVEIVSEQWRKDYDQAPQKYAQLGARELVIFDPEAVGLTRSGKRTRRVPLQYYRRDADGLLVRQYAGAEPIWLDSLQVYLVVVPEEELSYLRLARDAAGQELIRTPREAQLQAEQERDVERQARLAEQQARLAAEELIARLQAELATRR